MLMPLFESPHPEVIYSGKWSHQRLDGGTESRLDQVGMRPHVAGARVVG
jgi:hypothetical protein